MQFALRMRPNTAAGQTAHRARLAIGSSPREPAQDGAVVEKDSASRRAHVAGYPAFSRWDGVSREDQVRGSLLNGLNEGGLLLLAVEAVHAAHNGDLRIRRADIFFCPDEGERAASKQKYRAVSPLDG